MADNPASLLSKRAKPHAQPSAGTLIWEVLSDQWDPKINPNGYVSIGVAENRLMHDELHNYITSHCNNISTASFTYGDGPTGSSRLRNAVCQFLNRYIHPIKPLEPSHLIVTNGVSHAIEHCAWAFADEGDGILLGQPYYGAFIPDLSLRPGAKVVEVKFGSVDPMSVEAVQNYESAILTAKSQGVSVKALMLCSPHNPLGRCYSRNALLAYLRLCSKYNIHLISDEIYALSVWNNTQDTHPVPEPFTSVLSINISEYINPALVHVLWGMSKDFGANGLRLGVLISQDNPSLLQALIPVAIYSYISGITDHIAAQVLSDTAFTSEYIQTNQARLSEAYTRTVTWLREHQIPYTPGANAAFFLWVDLGSVYARHHPEKKGEEKGDRTQEIMDSLLKQKVFLASGAVFGSETPGVFRIVFTHPWEYMSEALRRMVRGLKVGLGGQETNDMVKSKL
jgi:1-aminocyclopropane-1-carboxylate synthase